MSQEEAVDVFDPSGQVARGLAREGHTARKPERPSWERSYRTFDADTQVRALAAQARGVLARRQRSGSSCTSCGIAGWQGVAPSGSVSESAAFGSPMGWEPTGETLPDSASVENQSLPGALSSFDLIDRTSRGASELLEFLSPYLGPITEALEPLLSAHGLSAADATTDDVIAIDGLAEEIVAAAQQVIAQIDAVDSLVNHPFDGGGGETLGDIAPEETPDDPLSELDPLEGAAIPGWDVAMPSVWVAGRTVGGKVSGWVGGTSRSASAFAYDAVDQDPCYPNIPGLEEYFPKCPQPSEAEEVPCTKDDRFLRADERLREHKGFFEIPNDFREFPYRDLLKDSVDLSVEELYRCDNDKEDLASWIDSKNIIKVSSRFLDLNLGEEVLSVLTRGKPRFRAGVLLHEHVHRIEDDDSGTVSPPDERSYKPVGSAGQEKCPNSGTEYDGAYIQALYAGATIGFARMFADIYARSRCDDISPSAKLLAAVGDIIEWLELDRIKSSIVVAAFTGTLLLGPGAGITILAASIPAQLLALLLLVILPGPSGYP